ncbi:MarR family winged helix-turn-helix transcriptional regulator [Mycolicibacterium parafortuitum]|uniref:MarR family transcriptional regulator [Tsukamurella paurometabola DSM] n=1 Tax=Mycolicibacterium parafortuitum TaxID=39692 RepID=A0A375YRQ8_MYCPF|nr:MarR family transcriptional regulator [Mycolicibacterium parafortuitum]ORB29578.1 MarR family transcriptional regulator [Mycolicibacterium parafortuitum]SRX83771.1 MarR family transcriptional regulator [Tsukamurella paurometabola DSM] [Mycolicibacterium parafortuitum]
MTLTAEDVDPLALERQVCFALAATNRAVLALYRPLLEPLGLTHPKYLVMLVLWDHQKISPSTSLSVKKIASTLQMDSATLSPMLKRLESLGLISRARNATDERSTDVTLTDKGLALRERALEIPEKVVARLGMSLAELERVHEVLTRLNAAAVRGGALQS